jgi:hypothetical protein
MKLQYCLEDEWIMGFFLTIFFEGFFGFFLIGWDTLSLVD